jgi:hypothetical protein
MTPMNYQPFNGFRRKPFETVIRSKRYLGTTSLKRGADKTKQVPGDLTAKS